MLWMPSWGGMINGLMTLSGAWDKLRTDPALRFMVTSVGFYGMATFEGPVMSVRQVNALSHYTDWTIGHVHSGVLGWNAFICFGAIYWLVPRLFGARAMWSSKLIAWHYWIATIGIVLYITSMWVAGIMQGLMWRAFDRLGFLQYSFVENRRRDASALSGARAGRHRVPRRCAAAGGECVEDDRNRARRTRAAAGACRRSRGVRDHADEILASLHREERLSSDAADPAGGGDRRQSSKSRRSSPSKPRSNASPACGPIRRSNWRGATFMSAKAAISAIRSRSGRFATKSNATAITAWRRKACTTIPFQWGSKRTGPDLARVGGKYSNDWQAQHLADPRLLVPESVMPRYQFLAETPLRFDDIRAKLVANRTVGVPYDQTMIDQAKTDLLAQLDPDADTAFAAETLSRRDLGAGQRTLQTADRNGRAGRLPAVARHDGEVPRRGPGGPSPMSALLHWVQQHSVLLMFLIFVPIVVWAYAPARKEAMKSFSRIPLEDDA